jgi:hypothetical protein
VYSGCKELPDVAEAGHSGPFEPGFEFVTLHLAAGRARELGEFDESELPRAFVSARSRRQMTSRSGSVMVVSRRETKATGTSPHLASDARTTAASVMRGSLINTRSISAG